MKLQRTNAVQPILKTDTVFKLRDEYQSLDIFDQASKHEHYKSICEIEGIDYFLLICKDSHFSYLNKNNLIEKF